MKKIVITLIASLCLTSAIAQSGYIIHKVYEPLQVELLIGLRFDYDITGDTIPEFYFEQSHVAIENSTLNGWQCCTYNPNPEMLYSFQDLDIAFDDESMAWGNYFTPYCTTAPGSFPAIYECKEAMRLQQGDDKYYGWWDGKVVWRQDSNPIFILRESCYCTIPNYPLRFGQTDLLETEEVMARPIVTVLPNPTGGIFTVEGLGLHQAEVYNALGQRVASVQGQGETLQIDIANLPAGIYFVNVTDSEGRKCVKKVVKE